MGVLAGRGLTSLQIFIFTAAYLALAFGNAWRHEPWADEAQAWLVARDSSFASLWSTLLHYEGTPGLWHTLLFALTRLHVPYAALSYCSAALGAAAAYLVFRYAPFALPLRLLLPFTYFLGYQYAVVARSYALLPPLLFGIAALYPNRYRKPLLYAGLLCALALCSMHGLALAVLIAIATFRHPAAGLLGIAAGLAIWSAWPAADVTFVRNLNYSVSHAREVAARVLAQGFTGEWLTGAAAIASSLPFLARGKSLWLFVSAAASLIALAAVVYGQVWHFGIVFLAWIFSLWLAGHTAPWGGRTGWLAAAGMALAIMPQGYDLASSSVLEWQTAYSGSRAAAAYLAEREIPAAGVYGMGYACVALQPYFRHNIFRNFDRSYWDWSSRNRMIPDYPQLRESNTPWVLVGYKTDQENYLWNSQARRQGYRKVKHFSGGLIWRGEVFEPESYDLYQRL